MCVQNLLASSCLHSGTEQTVSASTSVVTREEKINCNSLRAIHSCLAFALIIRFEYNTKRLSVTSTTNNKHTSDRAGFQLTDNEFVLESQKPNLNIFVVTILLFILFILSGWLSNVTYAISYSPIATRQI